jgi:hypothetical protein
MKKEKTLPHLLSGRGMLKAGLCIAGRTDRDNGRVPGWESLSDEDFFKKYEASLGRHFHEYMAGIQKDEDSGLHPIFHLLSNAAIIANRIAEQEERKVDTADG